MSSISYVLEGEGRMQVTPNGNGYDVRCPRCGKMQRAFSADARNPHPNQVHGNGTIDFTCNNEDVPVLDPDGNPVPDALSACGFSVTAGVLVGNM